MRLLDLDPSFLKRDSDVDYHRVASIAEADGVQFLCPKCFVENGGAVGTQVPQSTPPVSGRWRLVGTSLSRVPKQHLDARNAVFGTEMLVVPDARSKRLKRLAAVKPSDFEGFRLSCKRVRWPDARWKSTSKICKEIHVAYSSRELA